MVHGGGAPSGAGLPGDLIFGGGNGDTLCGDSGNASIYAGAGNETLYGGDGLGLFVNSNNNGLINAAGDDLSSGSNLLVGGTGNDVMYGDSSGHNTLQAGSGNDLLYAGTAGDYLAAGPGQDTLIGGRGNDSLQLAFSPTGRPLDSVVGGPGLNTLILEGGTVYGTMAEGVTSLTAVSSTSPTITVSSVLVGYIEPLSGLPFAIQVDGEQMLVTAVTLGANSTDTLTVTRGYNGTAAASHVAGAFITPVGGTPAVDAITATATTITLASAVLNCLEPPGGTPFTIQIDNEQMQVTAVAAGPNGTDSLTVTRGYNSTTAAAHLSGAFIAPARAAERLRGLSYSDRRRHADGARPVPGAALQPRLDGPERQRAAAGNGQLQHARRR